MNPATHTDSLRSSLTYEPLELQFGTSGRRGKVVDLTQLEVYINALAELEYLQSRDPSEGGIVRGEEFFFARDLRQSSDRFVPEQGGRGEIAQAIAAAIRDAGMRTVNLGLIPTPALMCYALARGKGSIMVTGSHIPFDRNGYKTNSSRGELLKQEEAPISERVRMVRQRLYDQRRDESLFDHRGLFKSGHQELPAEQPEARAAWIERFTSFFAGQSLGGKRILVYQHSAVGRDLLVEVLERMSAEVIAAGRSDTFVPIDTENIGEPQLAAIQALADEAAARHGPLDAIVSTDGDSDRPLILGVNPVTAKAHFFGGDLVGMVVAEYLQADAVVVPISCNDAVDRGALAGMVEPKTRIGSPFVIAGIEEARRKGKQRVCGWEANGGFLTGSDIERDGATLRALPTRDAILPILGTLFAAAGKGLSLVDLFAQLPKRFSRAALLEQFPRAAGLKLVAFLSPGSDLARFFTPAMGFGKISHVDYTDGVRVIFDNGDVAHVRPSGNADELRIYAVADTQDRADAIAAMGVAEPNGILRCMEKAVEGGG
ncbi:MAG: phosphomannomutase [Bryobacteraceae bacterium]|jgi:phosphomannomutase